ncbi:EF-hand domain-containing protein [Orientia tsutsugamushi]|uniref:Uncharacterized protein n=1 Tax=Orientia tsutsugamushi TaxID=784 RepID=A0A2U3RBN8_ORITS|nr:EF-hand domain-containing protein [Orientia tsutsugamushi]KJV55546.1 hypothetical protein OTSKATO_0631 [Orientia tsutsugamushi str. Kato PP]SPR10646.1 Uncharacterised protein [Orientia tsutsugamushi]
MNEDVINIDQFAEIKWLGRTAKLVKKISGNEHFIIKLGSELLTEYIIAPLYKKMLHDSAPDIGLVKDSNYTRLLVKYYPDFLTLDEFNKAKESEVRPVLKGLEEYAAAIIIGMEEDTNIDNIGIVKSKNVEGGNEIYNVVKIDHGRSGVTTRTENGILNIVQSLQRGSKQVLDMHKFKKAIDTMIQVLNEEEIYDMFVNRINMLKDSGFNVEPQFDHYLELCKISNTGIHDAATTYTENILKQLKIVKKFTSDLGLILKADISKLEKDSGWLFNQLQSFDRKKYSMVDFIFQNQCQIDGMDPFKWALDNNYCINGKNPIEYAVHKNFLIDKMNPIIWAQQNNITEIHGIDLVLSIVKSGYEIEGKDAVLWCIDNKVKINGQESSEFALANGYIMVDKSYVKIENDVIKHALKHGYKIKGQDISEHIDFERDTDIIHDLQKNGFKISGKSPVEFCIAKGMHICRTDPVDFAVQNNYQIEGKNPLAWAINNNYQIATIFGHISPMEYAVRNKVQIPLEQLGCVPDDAQLKTGIQEK